MYNSSKISIFLHKKIYIVLISFLILIMSLGGILTFFFVNQNTKNFYMLNTTTETSTQVLELNLLFRLKSTYFNEYFIAPIRINFENYDKAAKDFEKLLQNISETDISNSIDSDLLYLSNLSNQFDLIFFNEIVPFLGANKRIEAEKSRVNIQRIVAEYEENNRILKVRIASELEKSISNYKRFLSISLILFVWIFIFLYLIIIFIVIAIRYKQLLVDKTSDYNEAMRELMNKEKLASLGLVVSRISHDINTPLGNAILSTSYLRDSYDELKEKYSNNKLSKDGFSNYINSTDEIIERIEINLNRTNSLVKSFKNISTNQNIEIENIKFNLYKLIEETLFTLKNSYNGKTIDIEIYGDKELMFEGHPGFFSQIITNLIMNSIIHGFSNMNTGKINIKIEHKNQNLFIIYTDDGVGMNEEVKNRIFDPFFTTNRENGGSGLGMNIVYNIIQEHLHGEIICESKPNKGVYFKMSIPIKEGELYEK